MASLTAEPTTDAALGALCELPRRFGRYTLFDFVGRGGMAELYLARAHFALGGVRLAVVKQILPQYAADPAFAEMLVYEAKLAARLSHANIVQVFDLGREDGHLYIAMEYVEGLDLNALLRACSQSRIPFPHDFAVGIVIDLLRGLDYAHRRVDDDGAALGIVHRDVSPSNVLVSFEGEVKLCDFGIARANDSVQGISPELSDDTIKGKAGYMSPEQARGEPLDGRSDVFGAGIVLWELLAGRRMYRSDGVASLLDLARAARIPPFPDERDLHDGKFLLELMSKALEPNRADRFANAATMLRALEDHAMRAKFAPNSLRLGEWLRANFADELSKKKATREETLAKQSLPPGPAAPPAAPDVPDDGRASPPNDSNSFVAPAPPTFRGSEGAMRAFARGLDEGSQPAVEAAVPASPESKYGPSSLTAATVDVAPPEDERQREPGRVQPTAAAARGSVTSWVLGILVVLVLLSYLLARS